MSNEESIPSTSTAGDHSGHSIPGIRPPQPLNIDSNVTENWKLFRQKWTNYAIITNLNKHNDQYQVALFLHTLGDEALRVYNGFHFTSSEEYRKVDEILSKFDSFAIGEVNETYERFVFNKRTQKEGESFESFHAAIRTLIRTCNYCEDCIDSILRDRIVIGIRDADTQTSLLKQRSLTLQQAIDLCKAAENASTQGKALRPETVHKVTAKSSKYKGTPARDRDPHKQTQDEQNYRPNHKPRICKFCNKSHILKKELCPVWGKTCSTCKKRNHFSVKCPRNTSGNKVHSVEEHTLYSSDEEWIKSVRTPDGSQLKCKMIVAGREIVFQIDTGATVNILPARYATDVKPTTKTLQMWNNSTAIPMGTSRLSLLFSLRSWLSKKIEPH